jgi:hypothetical protein
MSFSDEDLKQLKGDIPHWEHGSLATRIESLLARLEAAEKFNSLARVIFSKKHPDEIDAMMLTSANEAWRKAAGK